jgi:hypothetical protein
VLNVFIIENENKEKILKKFQKIEKICVKIVNHKIIKKIN